MERGMRSMRIGQGKRRFQGQRCGSAEQGKGGLFQGKRCGSAELGGEKPKGLAEAEKQTLEIRRVILGFRRSAMAKRDTGMVRDIVEAWYVGRYAPDHCLDTYPQSLELRNPYALYKKKHPELSSWYAELDYLLDEIPLQSSVSINFPLNEDDTARLLQGLEPGGKLAHIISPSPFLTHDENVGVAVMDATLWLRRSALPLVFGTQFSYADTWECDDVSKFPKRPALPSPYYGEVRMFCAALHRTAARDPSYQVLELAPEDFPEDTRGRFWARLARVRFPHLVKKGVSVKEHAAWKGNYSACETRDIDYLEFFREYETPEMYRLYAKLFHDRTPEEHEEEMAREEEEADEEL